MNVLNIFLNKIRPRGHIGMGVRQDLAWTHPWWQWWWQVVVAVAVPQGGTSTVWLHWTMVPLTHPPVMLELATESPVERTPAGQHPLVVARSLGRMRGGN